MSTKNGENLLHEDLSYKIRGACFEVWREFGNAFKELVVRNALVKKLVDLGLGVEVNKVINIYFENEKIGTYKPDLVVNGVILIELKRKPYLTKQDDQQFWYYLKCTNYKLGFLINFADHKLEIKRRIFDKARKVLPQQSAYKSAYKSAFFRLDKKGFTLVEMLVALSIFAIFSLAILGTYISSLKASQRTIALSQAQQETQLIMSALAKKIRFSRLDYDYYASYGAINPDNEHRLALVDYDNKRYLFLFSGNSLYVSVDDGVEVPIPAQRIKIQDMNFVIRPLTSPFDPSAPPTDQPRVTISMEISLDRPLDAPHLIIQQTVPQRLGGL